MTTPRLRAPLPFLAAAAIFLGGAPARAQNAPPLPGADVLRQAAQLDLDGKTSEARGLLQHLVDSLADPAALAAAHRAMAMSYAFDGDCRNTVAHEEQVIDYWKTREQAEPQNAFYQEGEMANEAARVCIDAGDLPTSERMYRRGSELGLREPEPRSHSKSLWDYRLAHALGRIAARRGDAAEAKRQVAAARRLLDADTAMAAQQERFFPYLTGYVALYTNDLPTAEHDLMHALEMRGNERDPFMHALLAEVYAKQGRQEEATRLYREAFMLARAHNPPSAYVRRVVRERLGPKAD